MARAKRGLDSHKNLKILDVLCSVESFAHDLRWKLRWGRWVACRDAQLHMHLMARKLLDDIGEDCWKTDHVTPLPGSQQELEELQTLMETMKSGSAGIIHFPADCSNKLMIVTFNEEKEMDTFYIPRQVSSKTESDEGSSKTKWILRFERKGSSTVIFGRMWEEPGHLCYVALYLSSPIIA